MVRIFSFALGNIWSWTTSKNRDDLIKYARKLDISGVEITFARKEEVYAFKLSKDNKSWLRVSLTNSSTQKTFEKANIKGSGP